MKALDYHETTKHSWERIHADPHSLDSANMPRPFKIYSDVARKPLPTDMTDSSVPALLALAEPRARTGGKRVPSLNEMARLLSAVGVTKRRRYPGGEILFRGASCTGALYHIEVYVVCANLGDLPAGVYQFQPKDFSVCPLRAGDYRQTLVDASGAHAAVAEAPVVLVLTSTWWRNAWKYQARAYRHAWWDSGCMVANLLAQAAALELSAEVVVGYADDPINRLLDVDPDKEASLMLMPIGHGSTVPTAPPPRLERLGLPTEPFSRYEVAYPEIPAAHAGTFLDDGAEAAEWRVATDRGEGAAPERLVPLEPAEDDAVPAEPVEFVIRRRGSTRRFIDEGISFTQLSTILDRTNRAVAADFLTPSGTYLADLQRVSERFGDRGYRAAELEGGIRGGKVYLAAYALRLGATGLTFLDDDVTAFFSPHAAGKAVMFLIAVGRPRRRTRQP